MNSPIYNTISYFVLQCFVSVALKNFWSTFNCVNEHFVMLYIYMNQLTISTCGFKSMHIYLLYFFFLLRSISSTDTVFLQCTLYTTCMTKKSYNLFCSNFFEYLFFMIFSGRVSVSFSLLFTFSPSLELQYELVPT